MAPPHVRAREQVLSRWREGASQIERLGELAVRRSRASGTAPFILDVNGYVE